MTLSLSVPAAAVAEAAAAVVVGTADDIAADVVVVVVFDAESELHAGVTGLTHSFVKPPICGIGTWRLH